MFSGRGTVGMRVLTLRFSFKQELEESKILTFTEKKLGRLGAPAEPPQDTASGPISLLQGMQRMHSLLRSP